jgi:tRNA(Met) C34 N-acetyltransferase TmcA
MKFLTRLSSSSPFGRRTPTFVIDPGAPAAGSGASGNEQPRREGRVERARSLATEAVGAAFTPTQPKAGRRYLVGRAREQARIVQALLEDRAHVVLYSERGRGKTSLANWVIETLRRSGVMVGRYTCDATTTYDELARGAVRDLPASLVAIETIRHGSLSNTRGVAILGR